MSNAPAREGGTKRVLVLAPLFPPATLGGGPIRSVDALVASVPAGFDVSVITSDRDLGRLDRLRVDSNRWIRTSVGRVRYVSTDRVRCIIDVLLSSRRLDPDCVYVNGFFELKFSIFPQVLFRIGFWRGGLLLIAPRGEFGQAALGFKEKKKKMYLSLYRLLRFDRRAVWHASSVKEREDIHRIFGVKSAVIVRENQTRLPMVADGAYAVGRTHRLRLVFLARLVPIKGLLILLRALVHEGMDLLLDVYGAEEDPDYVGRCMSAAKDAAAGVTVNFRGPLAAEAVRNTLKTYDFLVLPTGGENFGHVIAESLSVSTPVVCSDRTPWTSRLKDGGGVVVDELDPAHWADTVVRLQALSIEERASMRLRAAAVYSEWRAAADSSHIFTELFSGRVL